VFIDLGAFDGDTVELALKHLPPFDDVYCFEPLAIHCETMKSRFQGRGFHVINAAADVVEGSTRIFMGGKYGDISCSIYEGNPNCTSDFIVVSTIDFPKFLRETVRASTVPTHITLKLNIEGSEYPILERMLEDGSISMISSLYCDWHWQCVSMREEEHHALVARLRRKGFPLCGDKLDELHNSCGANPRALKLQKWRVFHTRGLRLFLEKRAPIALEALRVLRRGLRSLVQRK